MLTPRRRGPPSLELPPSHRGGASSESGTAQGPAPARLCTTPGREDRAGEFCADARPQPREPAHPKPEFGGIESHAQRTGGRREGLGEESRTVMMLEDCQRWSAEASLHRLQSIDRVLCEAKCLFIFTKSFICLFVNFYQFFPYISGGCVHGLLLLAPPLWSWPFSTGRRGQRAPFCSLDRLLCPPRAAGAGDLPRSLGCAPRPSGVHVLSFPTPASAWEEPSACGPTHRSPGRVLATLGLRQDRWAHGHFFLL